MTTFNDTLITNLIIGKDELTPHFKKGQTYGQSFQRAFEKGFNINKGISKITKNFRADSDFVRSVRKGISYAFGKSAQIKSMDKFMSSKILSDPDFFTMMERKGKAFHNLEQMGIDTSKQQAQLKTQFGSTSDAIKALNSGYDKAQKQMELTNQKAKEMANRFDMNTLSWVFGGMALQRMGLVMTRFLIPSMDQLQKLNNESAKKTMAVGAAFEFLKISMFETLSQTPLFQSFVEWIVKGAIWIAEFTQKNPQLVETSAILGGIATVLGTMAIGVGIFKQLEHLEKLSKLNKIISGISKTIDDKFAAAGFVKDGNVMVRSIQLGLGVYLAWDAAKDLYASFTSGETAASRIFNWLKASIGVGLLANAISAGTGTNFFLLTLSAGVVIELINIGFKKFVDEPVTKEIQKQIDEMGAGAHAIKLKQDATDIAGGTKIMGDNMQIYNDNIFNAVNTQDDLNKQITLSQELTDSIQKSISDWTSTREVKHVDVIYHHKNEGGGIHVPDDSNASDIYNSLLTRQKQYNSSITSS